MTKLKTLITTILLATSSMAAVASAHPAQGYYGERSSYSPRDHRTTRYDSRFERAPASGYVWTSSDGRYDERDVPFAPQVTALSQPTPAVGPWQISWVQGMRAASIRLDVQRGSMFVSKIAVELADGQMLIQPINRTLSARDRGDALIDLAGMQTLTRVIVYTPNGARASYQLLSC